MNTSNCRDKLYPLELAMLLALCATLLLGLRVGAEQRALSDKLVRLHVIAVSDTAEDQAVKLRVRDAVLSRVEPALAEARDAGEAAEILRGLLPELENTARWISGQEQVRASLGRENYPTRHYEDFSLPAGEYTSLRIELGEARGQNWWCVVYPPMCAGAATDRRQLADVLDRGQEELVTGGQRYIVRFKIVEWCEKILYFFRNGRI